MHGASNLVDGQASATQQRPYLDHPQPGEELFHDARFDRRQILGAQEAAQPATVRPWTATRQMVGGQRVQISAGIDSGVRRRQMK